MAGAFALIVFEPCAAGAAMMRFKIDVDRSTVSVSVAEPAAVIRGSATGTFRIIDGAVSGDPADIQGTAKVRILIDATSYRSNSPSRDRAVTRKIARVGQISHHRIREQQCRRGRDDQSP